MDSCQISHHLLCGLYRFMSDIPSFVVWVIWIHVRYLIICCVGYIDSCQISHHLLCGLYRFMSDIPSFVVWVIWIHVRYLIICCVGYIDSCQISHHLLCGLYRFMSDISSFFTSAKFKGIDLRNRSRIHIFDEKCSEGGTELFAYHHHM